MNLFQRISPEYALHAALTRGGMQVVRERMLQILLLAELVVAACLLMLAAFNPGGAALILLTVGTLYLLVILLWRELAYSLRVGSFLAGLLGFAAASWLHYATPAIALLCLAAVPPLAALLFRFRAAIVSALLAAAAAAAVSAIPIPGLSVSLSGVEWLPATLAALLLSCVTAAAVSGMLHGLADRLAKREQETARLEHTCAGLENQERERSEAISHRLAQVRTAAEISSAISRWTDSSTLYNEVVNLIQQRFQLYYAGIFLVDQQLRYAVLAAGSGEPGRIMLEQHHRLQIASSSMIGWCIANRKARVALDVGSDAVRFNNPYLPRTRSELALPIISHTAVLGALTVQSAQPSAFDEDDILVLQGIADGLAAAIENARLVSELQRNLDELRGVNRAYTQQAWSDVAAEQGPLMYAYETPDATEAEHYPVEVPVKLRDQVIANLTLDTSQPELSPEDRAFVLALADQIALALENARLVHKTGQRADFEQTLNELNMRFSNALDIDSILKTAVETLGRLPSVTEVSVELVAPADGAHLPGNGREAGR